MFPPGDWYAALEKPSWNPPSWLFGPVWAVLYVLIGIAGWRLWRARAEARTAYALWWAQLVLNALWSWIFFGLEAPGPALAEILLLLAVIAATMAASWRPCRSVAWLLSPYLAWVAFASVLNGTIWSLN